MKRLTFLPAIILFSLLGMVVISHASEIAYEGFTPSSFPIYANGGTGFSGPWVQGVFIASAAGFTQNKGTLCYANLQTSSGSISGGTFSAVSRPLSQTLGASGTTVYVSFLLKPEGTLINGLLNGFFGLSLNGNNILFIGKPGGGYSGDYVMETFGGSGQVSSGTPAVLGRTELLVVKAEFLNGNDRFTLYTEVNPDKPEPAKGAVKADLDLGSVSEIGIVSTGPFVIDEIRIGTTYADVVPTIQKTAFHQFEECLEDNR